MPPALLRRGGLRALVATLLAPTFALQPTHAETLSVESCCSIDAAQASTTQLGYRHVATLTGSPLASAARMFRATAPDDDTAFDFALMFNDPAEGGGVLLLGSLWPSVARQVLGEPA